MSHRRLVVTHTKRNPSVTGDWGATSQIKGILNSAIDLSAPCADVSSNCTARQPQQPARSLSSVSRDRYDAPASRQQSVQLWTESCSSLLLLTDDAKKLWYSGLLCVRCKPVVLIEKVAMYA